MVDFVPENIRLMLARVLLVVLALLLLWLVRNLLVTLISRPLERMLTRSGRSDLNAAIRQIVIVPVRYLLLAFGIHIVALLLELQPNIMTFVTHVTRTLVIVAVALIIYRLIDLVFFSGGTVTRLTGAVVSEALLPFARTGLNIILAAVVIVIIVQEWGYDVTGLLAGLGLGGLAFSLAATDTLSNLFGFTAIVGDRPFVVGESVKTKDVEGTIEYVGLRSTRVRQLDQAVVTVPNSMLANSAILNWSRLSRRRIDTTIGIPYETRAEQLQELLERLRALLENWETVDKDTVVVYFVNFGQNALEVLVRCYLNIPDWKEFTAEKERILLAVMATLEELGLHIAVPNRVLYLPTPDMNNEPGQSRTYSQDESE